MTTEKVVPKKVFKFIEDVFSAKNKKSPRFRKSFIFAGRGGRTTTLHYKHLYLNPLISILFKGARNRERFKLHQNKTTYPKARFFSSYFNGTLIY